MACRDADTGVAVQMHSFGACFRIKQVTLLAWLHLLIIDFFQARHVHGLMLMHKPLQSAQLGVLQVGGAGRSTKTGPSRALCHSLLHVRSCGPAVSSVYKATTPARSLYCQGRPHCSASIGCALLARKQSSGHQHYCDRYVVEAILCFLLGNTAQHQQPDNAVGAASAALQ